MGLQSSVQVLEGANPGGKLVLDRGARVILDLPGTGEGALVELWLGSFVLARDWVYAGGSLALVAPAGTVLCRVHDQTWTRSTLLQELSLTVAAGETKRIELLPMPSRER